MLTDINRSLEDLLVEGRVIKRKSKVIFRSTPLLPLDIKKFLELTQLLCMQITIYILYTRLGAVAGEKTSNRLLEKNR